MNYCTQPVMVLEGQLPLRCLHSWNKHLDLAWLFVREWEKRKGVRMQQKWSQRWLKRSKPTLTGANNTEWTSKIFCQTNSCFWQIACFLAPKPDLAPALLRRLPNNTRAILCPILAVYSLQSFLFFACQKIFATGDSLPKSKDLRLPVFIPP